LRYNWFGFIDVNYCDSISENYINTIVISDNDSFMQIESDMLDFQRRLMETDTHLIMPSLVSTKFMVSASDVLHSFVILSTGVKIDAIVGRINEITTYILRDGLFFGQCSELCGIGHFGMPIAIESLDFFDCNGHWEFKNWADSVKTSMVPFISRTLVSEIVNLIIFDLAFLDVFHVSNILNLISVVYSSVESLLYVDIWVTLELDNLNFTVKQLIGLPYDNLNILQ